MNLLPDRLFDLYDKIQILRSQELEERKKNASDFNVFEILGLESSEVTLHSRLISEFLNPKGSHEQGELFLELFLKEIDAVNFKFGDKVEVNWEYFIGEIDEEYNEGGRIDILLSNSDQELVIENKIYADLGRNQILRYLSYINDSKKEGTVYLLSLFKSDFSNLPDNVKHITYENEIINWIKHCIDIVEGIDHVRITLEMYLKTIQRLTNKVESKVNIEIERLIRNSPEIVEQIEIASRVVNNLKNRVADNYNKLLSQYFKPLEMSLRSGYNLLMYYREDREGLWFGFKLFTTNIKGKTINNELTERIKDKLNSFIISNDIQIKLNSSNYHFIWYTPSSRNYNEKVIDFKFEEIIKMDDDDNYLKLKVIEVSEEANLIKANLEEVLKELK